MLPLLGPSVSTFPKHLQFTYATLIRGGAVVEALRYKPEGRGIES
jgi:hypothetical protein